VRELVHGFRRCWLRAVTLAVVGAAAAAAAAYFGMPQSRALTRSVLHVYPQSPYNLFPDAQSRLDFIGYKKTQAALIKSRMVLNAALRRKHVDPKNPDFTIGQLRLLKDQIDPVDWLDTHVVADYSAPEILTISLTGDDPEELVPIVNAITHVYLDDVVAKEGFDRLQWLDKLTGIYDTYKKRLDGKRTNLRVLADEAGANDPANISLMQRLALEQAALIQKELLELQSEVRRLTVQEGFGEDKAKEADKAKIPQGLVNEQIEKDLQVQNYHLEEARLQAQLDEYKRVNPGLWQSLPQAQQKQSELASVRKALDERRREIGPKLEDELRKQFATNLEDRVVQNKDRLAFLKKLKDRLTKDLKDSELTSKKLNGNGLDMENLRKELAQEDSIFERVGMQAETLKVEHDAPARVQLIEEGVVSRPDQRVRRMAATAGAGVGALALILFGLTWWECRSLRVNSADEVARGVGLKVMGALPLVPAARGASAFRAGSIDWQNLLLESVDLTRTMLLHVARLEGVRVVMVTSAVGGEGKTSLSSHLATSLARSGRKTLLVDCDLRKPSLHQIFDLPRPEGVCELLRGEVALAGAVQEAPRVPGLALIAGGGCDKRALTALARGGLTALFATLRGQFEFVIVDSSPVLPVADALLVAQEADGVLFSILRDVSQLGRITAAYERLAMLGIRTLGAVVTGAAADLYGYGRNYRYGGKYGAAEEAPDDAEPGSGELIKGNP
jgi:capsular exopolysaccharide synthesis family protein